MKDINGNINGESTMASLEQFLSYGCMADIVEDQAWATIVIRAPLGKKWDLETNMGILALWVWELWSSQIDANSSHFF